MGRESREQSPGRLVKACLLARPAKPSAFYITRNYIVQNYYSLYNDNHFVLQSLSRVRLFETPWTAAHQASLTFISQSLLKLMSVESVMLSNHLILCHPLLLLPSVFPSSRVFSTESASLYQVAKTLELQHQSFQ